MLPQNYEWSHYHRFSCPNCGEQLRQIFRKEDLYEMSDHGGLGIACENCNFCVKKEGLIRDFSEVEDLVKHDDDPYSMW